MKYKFLLITAAVIFFRSPLTATQCKTLSHLKLTNTTITSAQTVPGGGFIPPAGAVVPVLAKALPEFCRVIAEIKPSQDSSIRLEVWMPITGWNGRFRGQGNGGFAGSINYAGLAAALDAGYASASTDTGHVGSPVDASWGLEHPGRVIDFGYRAIHEMTVKSKAIVRAFYGRLPARSYFSGCSNGGRQALMEAQRYPDDYDGIVAGAPANYWTKIFATFVWDIQETSQPGSYIEVEKLSAIRDAVDAACDANDGVKDGILNDPRSCNFDPAMLLCKDNENTRCLTGPQVTALKKIYAGPRDEHGTQIFPGFEPGGEDGSNGWATWIVGPPGNQLQTLFATGFFKNMISAKEPVNLQTIKVKDAVMLAETQQGRTFDAADPNLQRFAKHGGKLLIYQGWSDPAVPPLGTIDYYNRVETALGRQQTNRVLRLFMAPGVQHCVGGPGANDFGQSGIRSDPRHDVHLALEQWVEKGITPEKIISTKYVNDGDHSQGIRMTRPLCAYPKSAKYIGAGSSDDAANFECAEPPGKLPFAKTSRRDKRKRH